MESLLPSEIARLVLGYLEEQGCNDAARLFLETSPNLQECRTVISSGRRFSTKVNQLSLSNILDQYTMVTTIVRERIKRVSDCEQVRQCHNLIDQLRLLIEETRGQRFVVNINVPSQNNSQASGSSPIISSSIRKRHHSSSERENRKRSIRSVACESQNEPVSSQCTDATPLESLPGHSSQLKSPKAISSSIETNTLTNHQSQHNVTSSNKHNFQEKKNANNSNTENIQHCNNLITDQVNSEWSGVENIAQQQEKCSTATNTEEGLTFSTAEVQTALDDILESEVECNDEPVENLSLLTKELLNRTELQERIAENINKAILPTDLSLREEVLNESAGELNTSVITELNNAIKSIVEATESDPIFEQFLNEIIGPQTDTDTSPDEDADIKLSNSVDQQMDYGNIVNDRGLEPSIITEPKITNNEGKIEVPLKQRLRSNSRQQNIRIDDEVDKINKDSEKDGSVLDDQNEAAIMSIINANINNRNTPINKIQAEAESYKVIVNENNNENQSNTQINIIVPVIDNITSHLSNTQNEKTKKISLKKPKPFKPKLPSNKQNELISNDEIITMPTLIVCSKEEVDMLSANQTNHIRPIPTGSLSQFIPIAPKGREPNRKTEAIYLRTVHVPQMAPKTLSNDNNLLKSNIEGKQVLVQQNKVNQLNSALPKIVDDTVLKCINEVPICSKKIENKNETESITLYGTEGNTGLMLDQTSMPTISIDENISLSGTGLSPYLKCASNKFPQHVNLSDIEIGPSLDNEKSGTETATTFKNDNRSVPKSTNSDIITKRTPRSLLKSRAKNHRLSLSTPRRRRSHIRALDFNTPIKVPNTTHKMSLRGAQFSPKLKRQNFVCRTSLFKSPPFTGSTSEMQVDNCSPKQSTNCRIPIATRSPCPKLMGGWDKHNGVGVIIGDTSLEQPIQQNHTVERKQPRKQILEAKSWDADLRKCLQTIPEAVENHTAAKKKPTCKDKIDNNVQKEKSKPVKNRTKIGENAKETQIKLVNKKPVNNITKTKVEDAITDDLRSTIKNSSKIGEDKSIDTANKLMTQTNTAIACNTIKANSYITGVQSVTKQTEVTPGENKNAKKYAKLKTLNTNLKENECEKMAEFRTMPEENTFKPVELLRISSDITNHMSHTPIIMDLETPRKPDTLSGIPPTPRLLSPNSSLITPFIKISDDLNAIKIRSFISTPEFPTTPGFVYTPPKNNEDLTNDLVKKHEYIRNSYYRPSSETETENELLPVVSESTSAKKLEITQFEVIKENLPREEAVKELKISSNSIDNLIVDAKTTLLDEQTKNENKERESVANTHSDWENGTSDSDSSSSSGSSSSSSSTSSSSSCGTTTDNSTKQSPPIIKMNSDSAVKGSARKRSKVNKSLIPQNSDKTSVHQSDNVLVSIETNEISPHKVFLLNKDETATEIATHETPMKDESLLEADISETPSSSKAGIDNLTNLTSKITAFEEEKKLKSDKILNSPEKQVKKIPKVDLKFLESTTSMLSVKSTTSIEHLACSSGAQAVTSVEKKFVIELEQKRQRMMAKFRDLPNSNKLRGKPNFTRNIKSLKNFRGTNLVIKSRNNQKLSPLCEIATNYSQHVKETLKQVQPDAMKDRIEQDAISVDNTSEKNELLQHVTQLSSNCSIPEEKTDSTSVKPEAACKLEIPETTNELENKSNEILNTDNNQKKINIRKNDESENALNKPNDSSYEERISGARNYGKSKNVMKSKVDMVKRDLFSDEENDQKLNRDRLITSDNEKSGEKTDSDANKITSSQIFPTENSKEELSSVLQCLELVPASKSDNTEEENNSKNEVKVEYHFVYNENSTLAKKRRRKPSNQELEMHVKVGPTYDFPEEVVKVLTATEYEEIFNSSPKIGRRVSQKKSPCKVDKNAKIENKLPYIKNNCSKPLATSSPVIKSPNAKKVCAKPSKVDEKQSASKTETRKRELKKNDESNNKLLENQIEKKRKRRASEAKNESQIKRLIVSDPQILLNNLDLEEFLSCVHGPCFPK